VWKARKKKQATKSAHRNAKWKEEEDVFQPHLAQMRLENAQ
jgi:hypothetical protein